MKMNSEMSANDEHFVLDSMAQWIHAHVNMMCLQQQLKNPWLTYPFPFVPNALACLYAQVCLVVHISNLYLIG